MAPTPNLVNKLFKLLGPDGIDPNLKRRLQSILQYPPESEPSRREVKKQWMGIIERRRVEHQLMVTEELQRLVFELNEIFKSGENDTLVGSIHMTRFKDKSNRTGYKSWPDRFLC